MSPIYEMIEKVVLFWTVGFFWAINTSKGPLVPHFMGVLIGELDITPRFYCMGKTFRPSDAGAAIHERFS